MMPPPASFCPGLLYSSKRGSFFISAEALITTLSEISRYYLLGWYIDPEKLKPGKFSTIKASVKGRSDLSVRVRQGSLDLSKLVQEKK